MPKPHLAPMWTLMRRNAELTHSFLSPFPSVWLKHALNLPCSMAEGWRWTYHAAWRRAGGQGTTSSSCPGRVPPSPWSGSARTRSASGSSPPETQPGGALQKLRHQRWNSWKAFLVEVLWHKLESSQTRVFVWFSTVIFLQNATE